MAPPFHFVSKIRFMSSTHCSYAVSRFKYVAQAPCLRSDVIHGAAVSRIARRHLWIPPVVSGNSEPRETPSVRFPSAGLGCPIALAGYGNQTQPQGIQSEDKNHHPCRATIPAPTSDYAPVWR